MPRGAGRGRPRRPASFDPNLAHALLGDALCARIRIGQGIIRPNFGDSTPPLIPNTNFTPSAELCSNPDNGLWAYCAFHERRNRLA